MKNIETQFDRWIKLIRDKAHQYEHEARGKGEIVTAPDLDDICNEMEAFKNGFLADDND